MKILLVLLIASSFVHGRLLDEQEIDEVNRETAREDDVQDPMRDWSIKPKSVEDIPGLTEDMLNEAIDEAKRQTEEEEKRTTRVKNLDKTGFTLKISHYKQFVPELEPARLGAMIMERTTKRLANKLGLSHKEAARTLEGLQSASISKLCFDRNRIKDPLNKVPPGYRTIDGKGNNRDNPEWGRAKTTFRRILNAGYADGISAPRRAKNGSALTNARKVSAFVFTDKNEESSKLSHMNMIWGQFIDHDIDHGAQPNVDCSGTCGLSGECFGIPVPQGDKPFRSKGKTCIQLKRDVPACTNPMVKSRNQISIKTAFIDGSQIYGDDPKVFNELRVPNTGLISERNNPDGECFKNLLPKQKGGFCRTTDEATMPCFRAGDARTNENPGLSSMHTIWSREHNRISNKLKKLNGDWSPDKLYFETRKIIGAMLQHINYNEFLPLLLNKRTLNAYDIVLKKSGHYHGYLTDLDPSISNAFAGAAYRFGHSQIQNVFHRFDNKYEPITPSIPMNRTFDPTFLYQTTEKEGVDSILRGLAKDKSQKTDGFFAKAVQEQLVRGPGDLSDLPALNIQRGREHGIPGYNEYRRYVGLKKSKTIEGFNDSMTKEQIKILEKVYSHPDDVDLFVGGLYEKPLCGAVMGRTFSFLLAEQFRRLRRGDRFWYENPGVFTTAQLKEIRKVTLAKVICDNSDGIDSIQQRVLAWQRGRTSCRRIRRIDLRKWRS